MLKSSLNNFVKLFYRSCKQFYSISATTENSKKLQLIDALKNEFKDISSIVPAIENNEKINVDFKEWKSRIDILKNYGFNNKNCFKLIKGYPAVLEIPENTLSNIIQQWNLLDLGLDNVQSILLNQPYFLTIPDDELRKRISYFHSITCDKNIITKLLIKNPSILVEDWKSILYKIKYLLKTKRIPMSDILHSQALSKSINFINLRLDILEKCGILKVIKVMPHKSIKTKHKNPHLNEIIDTSDTIFAKSVAQISEEEYHTYHDLYFTNNPDNEEFSDSDSDEENNYISKRKKSKKKYKIKY